MKKNIVAPITASPATRIQPAFLAGGDGKIIFSTHDAALPELQELADAFNNRCAAALFFKELLDSVETLTEIAVQHGPRTLSDLMYLQNAILSGGFIDSYPDESAVLEIAGGLESGALWTRFIKVEYLLTPAHD